MFVEVVVVCVETIHKVELGGLGRLAGDEQLKELCALSVRGNVWLVYLRV